MEIIDYANIGAVIREKRKQQQLTQDYVAWKSGYSITYVNRVERGKDVPRLDAAEAMLNALGCKVVIGVE